MIFPILRRILNPLEFKLSGPFQDKKEVHHIPEPLVEQQLPPEPLVGLLPEDRTSVVPFQAESPRQFERGSPVLSPVERDHKGHRSRHRDNRYNLKTR